MDNRGGEVPDQSVVIFYFLSLQGWIAYTFKSDKQNTIRAGFYTQGVEGVVPYSVFHDQPNGMASLDDRPILASCVNAIREVDDRVIRIEKALAGR